VIGTVASTAPSLTSTIIEPVSFRGRTISSLRRLADSSNYVLLDAVCRVFFPHQHNVDGFIRAAETMFRIPDERMTESEQRLFIDFYKLPTDKLKHNKLVRLDLLTDIFPRLETLFCGELGETEGQLIDTVIARHPGDRAATTHDGNTAQTTSTVDNNNESCDAARQRKRRRNNMSADIVVID